VIFPREALTFLEDALEEHPEYIAVIFAHCPLCNTVLDRDPERNLDNDSQDPFLYCSFLLYEQWKRTSVAISNVRRDPIMVINKIIG